MSVRWIAILIGVLFLAMATLLPSKWRWSLGRMLAVFLFTIRMGLLLWSWSQGVLEIPVEISTISYFLFSLVMMFRKEAIYDLAAFFSLMSGMGFFLFYGIVGLPDFLFTSALSFVVSAISHGILLFGGIVLVRKIDFRMKNRARIWIGILAILLHAAMVLDQGVENPTFVSYLVRLDYLDFTNSVLLNSMVRMSFLGLFIVVFQALIRGFYGINSWVMSRRERKQDRASFQHVIQPQ